MARLIITHIQSFTKRQPHINVWTVSAVKILKTSKLSVPARPQLSFMFQFQKICTRYFFFFK